jgi:DNA polymerase-3 subunit epsilon
MMFLSAVDKLGVFDTETTGVDRDTARIVTAYIGLMGRDGEIVKSREWLLDPGVEIPEAAIAVHGITTERAAAEGQDAATGVAEIAKAIADLLAQGVPVVAYNASYDLTVLDRELRRYGHAGLVAEALNPIVDPLVIDKAIDKFRRGKRTLEVTAAHYGVSLTGAHDAKADATATGGVAWAVIDRLVQKVPAITVEQTHHTQIVRAREQAESLQEYLRRTKPDTVVSTAWPLEPFVA